MTRRTSAERAASSDAATRSGHCPDTLMVGSLTCAYLHVAAHVGGEGGLVRCSHESVESMGLHGLEQARRVACTGVGSSQHRGGFESA